MSAEPTTVEAMRDRLLAAQHSVDEHGPARLNTPEWYVQYPMLPREFVLDVCDRLLAVEQIEKVAAVGPGDVLVINIRRDLTPDEVEAHRSYMEGMLGPGRYLVVFGTETDIAVVPKDGTS